MSRYSALGQPTEAVRIAGTIRRRVRSKVMTFAAVLGLAVPLTGVLAQPALASAYTCTAYGLGVTVHGVGVRPSQFCAQTAGSGTYVQTVGAGFSAPIAWAGWLTNTRVSVQFLNSGGGVYYSLLSGQQNGGSAVGAWKWSLNRSMQAGTIRYTLLSNGATIAVVQQTIK